jgi:hypothetical protein
VSFILAADSGMGQSVDFFSPRAGLIPPYFASSHVLWHRYLCLITDPLNIFSALGLVEDVECLHDMGLMEGYNSTE